MMKLVFIAMLERNGSRLLFNSTTMIRQVGIAYGRGSTSILYVFRVYGGIVGGFARLDIFMIFYC